MDHTGGASVLLQSTAWGGKEYVPFKRAIAQSIGLYTLPFDSEIEGIFREYTSLVAVLDILRNICR